MNIPPPGCRIVFTVDDDVYSVHLWIQFESEGLFPGVTWRRSDSLTNAAAHSISNTDPTLYILDSRIRIDEKLHRIVSFTISQRLGIDIGALETDDVVNGLYVAAHIKLTRPKSKVILLTAYHRTIADLRQDDRINRLFSVGCDKMLPKPCNESDVIRTVAGLLYPSSMTGRTRAINQILHASGVH